MRSTSKTLDWLRSRGYTAAVVERWIPWKVGDDQAGGRRGNRSDLWGFADILAFHPDRGILAVQCFTTAWKKHEAKLLTDAAVAPLVASWIEARGRVILLGWRKLKVKRGGTATKWVPRIGEISADDSGALRLLEVPKEEFDAVPF